MSAGTGGLLPGPGQESLRAEDLEVRYPGTDPAAPPALRLAAVEVRPGDSLALVGESGSGKTTALRALLGLIPPSAGSVTFGGSPVRSLQGEALRAFRRTVQLIPQDVDGALDPRQRIGSAIGEGWRAGGRLVGGLSGRVESPVREEAVVRTLLDEVGLPDDVASRHPHEVSGGQRQRAVIARALAVSPRILLLDEPTSGLDTTVQARILELIERLRADRGLGILLISHNLGVVARLCPTTLVLYRGEVVEQGDTIDLLGRPRHPYTAALRRSVPELGLPFRMPWAPSPDASAIAPLSGCRFGPRCPQALAAPCGVRQELRLVGEPPRAVRCARAEELGVLEPLE
jgi:oligopeptide/dipeptide ABC transporter ATP-binding protein